MTTTPFTSKKQRAEEPTSAEPITISERIQLLSIPESEMTPAVNLAVSALLERMDDIARELAQAKDHIAEIEQLVDVDCVAPIPNRRAFMRRLSWAISMRERYGHPSSLLYFDLNEFKNINDTYGHAAGDLAIRHVSEMLSKTLRESDFIARIGGDEFAIIMYYADKEAARRRGKKIVDDLHKSPLNFKGTPITIRTSFGYYSIQSGDDAEAALSAADMSMYVDKRRAKEDLRETES